MVFTASDAVVTLLSLATLFIVIWLVKNPFKKHHMNIFTHLMLCLVSFSLLMRSFFFMTGQPSIEENAKVWSLIWTYPLINMVVVSYTVSSHFVYDLMTIMYANQNPRLLRRQMAVFVIAIVVFVVIIYLIFMLSLPTVDAKSEELADIFYFLAIFEWVVAMILFCSVFLYVKKI